MSKTRDRQVPGAQGVAVFEIRVPIRTCIRWLALTLVVVDNQDASQGMEKHNLPRVFVEVCT